GTGGGAGETPAATPNTAASGTAEPTAPPEDPRSNVGVQLFQFNWNSVARECTDTLGPAGYEWVLISPAQEHIQGEEWWTNYQPVSYQVESRAGTREEFAAMVEACNAAGVKVIADAVINHMAGIDGGTGWAGTEFTHYEYPGLYGPEDFHDCGLTPNNDIANYQDAAQVQTCELSNLADLATGEPHVQDTIRTYLEDLLSLGVAGFRIDAAKHMAAEDVAAILEGLPEDTWIAQEVIRSNAEPIQPEDYLGSGPVFEFSYMKDIQGIAKGSSWNVFLRMGTGPGYVDSEDAVPFVTNHDTERNSQAMTYRAGEQYQIATVLMLVHGYGSPMVYSGYAFRGRDEGPPQDESGALIDATCIEGWDAEPGEFVCAHTWPLVNAAVRFDAVAGDAPLTEHYQDKDVLAVSRGDAFALINRDDEDGFTLTVPTGLGPGEYCDLGAGPDCSTTVIVGEDGEAEMTVGPMGAVILTALDLPDGGA
ncbi:MAG TPA: alpha-amylase, partial [Actinomycetales bacterium]|nr:alpha-amylase [Actinomycetales bacterium]